MNHKISKAGLDFIKGFESFVGYVYDDKRHPVKGKYPEWDGGPVWGTLTIGYGHTNAAKHPLKIKQGLKVTESEACEILAVDLGECEEQVNSSVHVNLSQGQYDALCSFNFNCGPGNLKKLIAPLNAGSPQATRAKFDAYTKSKGEVMRGLQRRRDGEQVLWDEGDQNLPTEIVQHPADVDAVAKPGVIMTAIGSRTVRASATGIALIVSTLQGWWNGLTSFVLPPADLIPSAVAETQASLDNVNQVAGWFHVNIEHAVMWIVLAILAYAIVRRVLDKREQQL